MEQQRQIAGLRAGSRDALRRVYEAHKADVLAVAAGVVRSSEAAWDVLHDVFVALATNARGLSDESNLRAYLMCAAANRARDRLRRKTESLGPYDKTFERVGPGVDPAVDAERREDVLRLQDAIGELPVEQRVVLTLHVYGGLTFREIAESEGIPENTAQSRYRYAMDKLTHQLRGVRS